MVQWGLLNAYKQKAKKPLKLVGKVQFLRNSEVDKERCREGAVPHGKKAKKAL